jgi:uncharacterized membrane protein
MIMKKKHNTTPSGIQTDSLGLERLIFFSDAVFAIAVTLLALEIRLPEGSEVTSEKELLKQIISLWPVYLSYFISFMVIGIFWTAHHRKFRLIKVYDRRLLLLNLLLLLVIAFIPFPTYLIGQYMDQVSTDFYALTIIVGEGMMALLWWYASRDNRLTDPHLDAHQRRQQFINPLVTALVFLFSMLIARFSPGVARLSWFLILVVIQYVHRDQD